MRVKPNILVTSEVLTFLNRPFFDKKQSLRRSYWNCCCCYLRACLEFVLVLSDLRQMEAKSLHYSGLLTTLQLRLAEGCWRNGFQDRFVQSGILSRHFLRIFIPDMVQLIQLKFEVNTCTFSCCQARVNVLRKVSTGFAFPLNWSRISQEISELIIAGVRNIQT